VRLDQIPRLVAGLKLLMVICDEVWEIRPPDDASIKQLVELINHLCFKPR